MGHWILRWNDGAIFQYVIYDFGKDKVTTTIQKGFATVLTSQMKNSQFGEKLYNMAEEQGITRLEWKKVQIDILYP